mgnify:CR=1 FL=1
MSIKVEIQPEAHEQLAALDQWWRTHRPAAPTLVLDELERAIGLLKDNPEIGRNYTHGGLSNIRYLRLRKTPYLLYYHYESGGDAVTIVSAWSGARHRRPPLKAP